MAGNNLSFSKIVATPTTNAWSQAYSAGSLFAAISLQSDIIPQEDESLAVLGKDIISTLESEFFPLEKKDLESIKGAVNATIIKVKGDIKLSFVVCYLNENILYLYALGGAKAILKREDKIGTVIDSDETREVKLASGYVQNKDIIVLETEPFLRTVATPTLASALDKNAPEDISEELAPHVHEKTEGGASAIVLSYNEASAGIAPLEEKPEAETEAVNELNEEPEEQDFKDEKTEYIPASSDNPKTEVENIEDVSSTPITPSSAELATPETSEEKDDESNTNQTPPYLVNQKSRRRVPSFSLSRLKGVGKRRLVILIIGIFILILLILGIFFFLSRGGSANQEQFNQIYNEARARFEEGQSLVDINEELAQENFREAQQILTQNQNTFPEGSEEDDQIEALLVQVNSALGTETESQASTTATQVEISESQLLSVQIDNPDSVYFTQNEDFIYFINANGVTRLDKGNSQEEEIIDESWEEAGGIGVFGSNVYILDKTDNILKFVPSGDTFSSSDYITDEADLTNSVAMTIDGSIYVLDSTGNVTKYTRGAEEEFSITGLEKSLSSPTRISTGEDLENIYILDQGNSRIVVIDKEGNFIKAYSADILKNARDIDPQEADGAIFVLSGENVYRIELE
jgi:hypothetical protein